MSCKPKPQSTRISRWVALLAVAALVAPAPANSADERADMERAQLEVTVYAAALCTTYEWVEEAELTDCTTSHAASALDHAMKTDDASKALLGEAERMQKLVQKQRSKWFGGRRASGGS